MSCTHAVIWVTKDTPTGGSKYPMLMQEALFKPLLRWALDALFAAGVRSFCVVRDDPALDELMLGCFAPSITEITVLDKHAEHLARDVEAFASSGKEEVVAVTAPVLLTAHAVETMCAAHTAGDQLLTELLTDDENRTGVYCFLSSAVGRVFSFLDNGFGFVPACLEMQAQGLPLGEFFVSDGAGGAARVTTPMELHMVRRALQTAVVERHIRQGVTILDPASTTIGSDVIIGRDTTILPGVMLQGESVIGEDCEIGPQTFMQNCLIGDRCTITASHLYESQLGSDVRVGPFAYLRPDCVLGSNIKIGDFVELKNAHVGSGTKIPHLSYVGDADIGKNVNIGCGSICVNYDGKKKHRTTVEDGAFIGCNSNLVAPVTVGARAYTAAGSTITEDVPTGALGVARARQINKEGWADKKRPSGA